MSGDGCSANCVIELGYECVNNLINGNSYYSSCQVKSTGTSTLELVRVLRSEDFANRVVLKMKLTPV